MRLSQHLPGLKNWMTIAFRDSPVRLDDANRATLHSEGRRMSLEKEVVHAFGAG
jgi:hypothetical protein